MLLASYLEPRGAAVRLASVLGVSASLVVQWGRGKAIPIERCPAIELGTEAAVSCEELRPDTRWHRVPDPAWPHRNGRPLIDVASGAAAIGEAKQAA